MTPEEWWTRWCLLWYAVGWRAVVRQANFNTEDLTDIIAALLMRIGRLEAKEQRSLFGWWGVL